MNGIRLFAVLAGTLVALAAPGSGSAASEGKVVIAQGVDPSSLDIMNQQETPASVVGEHIYNKLVERDQSLKIVPALAAELPKLISPQVWEVKLRKGVKFHNGEDFNADSAKFSLERVKDPKMRASSNFKLIQRVEIVDPYTVRVHTVKPWPTFIPSMNHPQAAMYPPKAYADKDTQYISKNPIGTGPYKYVRWSKDEEIVLEANENYYRGAPKIKTVVFRPIPDDAVRVAALQNGEIDVAVNIPPHLANIIANHPKLYLSTAPSVRTIQLMFSTHQFDTQNKLVGPYPGPAGDKRIRQAIAYALDVDEIIKGVLDGKGQRVATMLPSMHFGYDPSLKPIHQDLAKTKKLLAEAGSPNGIEIALNGPQKRSACLQPLQNGRWSKDRRLSRGQLDREWQAIQANTDLGDGRQDLIGELEGCPPRPGSLAEQHDRRDLARQFHVVELV